MKLYNIRLCEPIMINSYDDPTLIAYGEDNRDWGGAFEYTRRSPILFHHRFFNSPISSPQLSVPL